MLRLADSRWTPNESGCLRYLIELGAGALSALLMTSCLCAFAWRPRWRWLVAALLHVAAAAAIVAFWSAPLLGTRQGTTRALMFHHHVVVDRPYASTGSLFLVLAIVSATMALWIARGWRPGGERRPWVAPFVLGLGVIAGRFALDRAAAPEPVAHACGLLWWSVAIGPYLRMSNRPVAWSALRLAFATRILVVALNVLATRNEWGTHFSLERVQRVALPFVDSVFAAPPGSLRQLLVLVVLPQLVIWPMLTVGIAVLAARGSELVRFRR